MCIVDRYMCKASKIYTIRSVSEKVMLGHEARGHFIFNLMIQYGKYSVLVTRQGVV